MKNNWFRRMLGLKPRWVKEIENEGEVIYATKLEYNNGGFYDIKVGDKFEGAACGHWFKDQTCLSIEGDMVYGTSTLVIFHKKYIRPILSTNDVPKTLIYSK